MNTIDPRQLQGLTDFNKLLDFLRDRLDWPIAVEDLDAATYDYTADELGINPHYAARITAIKQLRPLVNDQVWGIFFIEFDRRGLPVMALRRILQALAISRRQRDASLPAWRRDDLLFICVSTSAAEGKTGQRGITFAHFRDAADGQTELRTFSWDSRETHFHYLVNLNLAKLRWPRDERDAGAWREQWRDAFTVRHHYVIRTAEKLAGTMAQQAVVIRELIAELYEAEGENGALHQLYHRLQVDLIHDLQPDDFADMIAQTITYGVFSAAVQSRQVELAHLAENIPSTNRFLKRMLETLTTQGGLDLDELGVGQLIELLRQVDLPGITRDFGRQTGGGSEDPVIHFYEQFLNEYDRKQRVQRGVFYTPDPVVDYMVRAVDEILQRPVDEGGFGIADGLASDATGPNGEPLVQILDPATGTGTFLAHIIDLIAKRKNPRGAASEAWDRYVAGNLLKRLNGFELMMAPYTIAHLKLGLKLKQTGYRFGTDERLRVFLTNTLEKPVQMQETLGETEFLSLESNEAAVVKRSKPIMVVIGNPPYAGLSSNMGDYIVELIQDYYKVDGQPLGERKVWLQDDYVKFIRFGQERIVATGEGVLAFITNHGYLTNPTFRGMRQQLLSAFTDIYIVDLHGNTNKRERTPSGKNDENVFDIRQGVSIGVFVRRKNSPSPARVYHLDVWGSRSEKYGWLLKDTLGSSSFSAIKTETPYYFFVPHISESELDYYGSKINEFFSMGNSGIVTARDHFVVDFDEDTLRAKIEIFLDETKSDDDVSQLLDLSENYAWRVSNARSQLKSVKWRQMFSDILYRPFDTRRMMYHSSVVWRTRDDVMRHLIGRDNLALIGSRSLEVIRPYDQVFCTRQMIQHHTLSIKEVNSLFPLYLYPTTGELFDTSEWELSDKGRRPNLSRAFVAQFAAKLGLAFVTDGRGDLHHTFGPEDVFHYAYAVFHSPAYRTRYAEQLKIDFPRLPLTDDVELFRQLVMRGVDLVALHLLEDGYEGAYWNRHREPSPLSQPLTRFVPGKNGSTVGALSKSRAYDPDSKRIYLDTSNLKDGSYFAFSDAISADEALATWEFQIGGYQVLHKWLYDRRAQGASPGRTLTDEDLRHYQRVVVALYLTRKLMDEIDEVIAEHGGFPLRGSSPEDTDLQPDSEIDITDDNGEDQSAAEDLTGDETVSDANGFFDQRRLMYADGEQLTLDDAGGRSPLIVQLPRGESITETDQAMNVIEGVENEDEDGEYPISQPFDPRDIKINTDRFSLDVLINRLREDEIDLSPAFQRMGGIWKDGNQSRLIESILIRLPLPAFYFDATDPDKWAVIDGLQRLTAIKRFVLEKNAKSRLRLRNMEFLSELNGKVYDDLDKRLMREIREAQVTAYMIQPGTPTQLKFNIFKRINTGGVPLSAQEIRHALYQGRGMEMLKRLAVSNEFKGATNYSVSPMRMADQELVLRFIAFARIHYNEYGRSEDLDNFVNTALEELNKSDHVQIEVLERRFYRAMNSALRIFERRAFRKQFAAGRVGPVSKALFEAWGNNLEVLSEDQIDLLVERRESLNGKFLELLRDSAFDRAISYSTGNHAAVQLRFGAIRRIIQEVLNG